MNTPTTTTHSPAATTWPNAGDPSALLNQTGSPREYIKLTGEVTASTLDTLERAGYWFRDNFSSRFRPEAIRMSPHHSWFVELVWGAGSNPDERTRKYAQGIVVGLLIASGHDVA